MAGTFTSTFIDDVMDHIFETTSNPTDSTGCQVALFIGDPTAAGTECDYTGYAREDILFDAAASRTISNTSTITFGQCTANADSGVNYYAIYEKTNGAMLAYGDLSSSVDINVGNTPSIAAGDIDISIAAGGGTSGQGMTTYCANGLLDYWFRGTTTPTDIFSSGIYVALLDTTIGDTASTISTEEVANQYSYARVDFADWTASSSGAVSNNTDIQFASASGGSWGTVTGVALVTSGTYNGGNVLFYDNSTVTDQAVGDGDTVKFSAGNFDVTLS